MAAASLWATSVATNRGLHEQLPHAALWGQGITNTDKWYAIRMDESNGALLVSGTFTPGGTQDVNIVSSVPLSVTQGTSPWVISGTVTANQGTSPWVVSLASTTITGTVAVTQSTSPWVVGQATAANLNATVVGTGTFAVQATLAAETTKVIGTVNQGTSPWVVSLSSTTITGTVAVTQSTSPWVTNISQINGVTPLMGSGIMGTGSLRVTIASDNDPLIVKQATAANLNATVVGTGTFAVQATLAAETTKVIGTVNQGTSPWVVSGTVTANAGTNLNTSLLALDTSVNGILAAQNSTTSGQTGPLIQGAVTTAAPSYTTAKTSPLSLTTGGLLRVDASGSTIPVSGTVSATQGTSPWVVSQGTAANLNATVVGTGTFAVQATLAAETTKVIGTVNQGTSPWVVSLTSTTITGTVAVTQSGAWTVTANAGTNLNTSALALDTSVNGILLAQASTTFGQVGPLIQGAVTTAAPSYTTAKTSPLSLTTGGMLRVDNSGVTQPISAVSLPLPAGASTSANQTTANTSLASIDTKTPALGQALAAASVPVVLTAAQITTLTPLTSVTVTQATAANLNATVVGTGTFAVQATLAAETTKVIGTVNQGTSPWVVTGSGTAGTAAAGVVSIQGIASMTAVKVDAKIALTASAPTAATVGTSSAQAVASNASRKGLVLINTSGNTISFGIGATAVLNSGITITPFGVWVMDQFNFATGAINAIASAASSNLAIQEFT